MTLDEFFTSVLTVGVGAPPQTYACVTVIPSVGPEQAWDTWFEWPTQKAEMLAFVDEQKASNNVYFSPHLFDAKDAVKSNVVSSRTIAADLDDADLSYLSLAPTIIVATSLGRHQAYWVIKNNIDVELLETLSRNMTYSIPRSDRTGWQLGRRMRVPDTTNFKYEPAPAVFIKDASINRFDAATMEMLPMATEQQIAHYDPAFVDNPPTTFPTGPQTLLENLRKSGKLAQTIAAEFNRTTKDRAKSLWRLETALFRAGLERNAAYWLARSSKNNLYADLKRGGDRELAKEILRAEAFVKTRSIEPKEMVMQARKLGGFHAERKQQLLNVVIDLMKSEGEFIRTGDAETWYIRRDSGRPVKIERHSSQLDTLLDMYYGLNATEGDHMYVNQGLVNYSLTLPVNAVSSALSYISSDGESGIFVHAGKKDVVKVTPTTIERISDGSFGVVFPWPNTADAFQPYLDGSHTRTLGGVHWSELLFGDGLDNVVNLTREEALAVMQVWFMFLLVRHVSISRPILALFGQPGSGKSTMFRRVYTLLYGRSRSLNAVSDRSDFDNSVANDPLVVLDNVDTWERWLPDQLALSASTSDITKRKLYENAGNVIVLKRQAMVALTAHNPQFGRPDVADRLLILNFTRLEKFRSENVIIERIGALRNAIWGGIIEDLQKLLKTAMPNERDVPQFRIEDFSRIGCWIADSLGVRAAFESAILRIKTSQRHFSLDDENVLIEALHDVCKRSILARKREWLTPGELWEELTTHCKDSSALIKVYRNAATLSNRLMSMQEPLREIFTIQFKRDSEKGSRVWSIVPKEQTAA